MSCYVVAMLQCYHVTMLLCYVQCYHVIMLYCYNVVLLLWFIVYDIARTRVMISQLFSLTIFKDFLVQYLDNSQSFNVVFFYNLVMAYITGFRRTLIWTDRYHHHQHVITAWWPCDCALARLPLYIVSCITGSESPLTCSFSMINVQLLCNY